VIHLGQLLAYLGRPDVSELVVASGRPITVMSNGDYKPLTATSISTSQIQELLRGTELERLIPREDSGGVVRVATIGGQPYRVLIARRENGLSLTVERGEGFVPDAVGSQPARTMKTRTRGDSEVTGVPSETRRYDSGPVRTKSDRITVTERAPQPTRDPRNAMADDRSLDSSSRRRTLDQPGSPHDSSPPATKRAGTNPIDIERSQYDSSPPATKRAGTSPISLDLDDDNVELGAPGARPAKFAQASSPEYTPPPHAAYPVPPPTPSSAAALRAPPPQQTQPMPRPTRSDLSTPNQPLPVVRPTRAEAPAIAPTQPMPVARTSSRPRAKIAGSGARTIPEGFADLVAAAQQRNATDLHLAPNQPPLIRMVGQLLPGTTPIDASTVNALLEPMLTPAEQAAVAERGYCDIAFDVRGFRVRANISKARGGMRGSFRIVWKGVPTLNLLGLPEELARITNYHQGLIVIAGPSGHGKTTTMAALVDLINSTKPYHILSVEDPIEIVHPRKVAMVSQRAVGLHTMSFERALKASLREDPDVIVIGEIRDRETVEIALTAAETGHLVLVTMSTPNAAKTIDRLIDMFPPDDQAQVRASLAAALRFIVTQRLMPTKDNDRVVPAVELLAGVLPVAALIRDNKLFQLPSVQQRGRAWGMIRFDDSLIELVRNGLIDADVALATAENPREMRNALGAQPPVKR
jgi:twitching motility protein PilT